jgi:hypothetical protein
MAARVEFPLATLLSAKFEDPSWTFSEFGSRLFYERKANPQ